MLYMKEMRAKVVAECTLKESAAINQILGRKVYFPYVFCKFGMKGLKELWVKSGVERKIF